MSDWRRSQPLALAIVVLITVVQLIIPISRLGVVEDKSRFGWQMFSVAKLAPEFIVQTTEGEMPVDLQSHMARVRADIDIVDLIPPHLCVVVEEAKAVIWEGAQYPCSEL